MGYSLGIDLGTTFTAAATLRDGTVEIVSLENRSPVMPSVVFVGDGTVLCGEAAQRRAVTDPGKVAREFKRNLGDPVPVRLDGSPYSIERLMAHLLRRVLDLVTEREGGAPDRVVLSHPANWGPFKQDSLREAARLADLADVALVSEPEAAAVHYASLTRVDPGTVLAIYDLGGGTFDATVLEKTGDGFRRIGEPEGIERLGGIDFDEAVLGHVRDALPDAFAALDRDDTAAMAAVTRLREECVAAKEALSADTDVAIPVVLPGTQTTIRLTRAELEGMIRPSIEETLHAMRRAIRRAGLEPEQLDRIVLVGGSSRIPLVAEMVGAAFGRPVAVDAHPKHAVALGVAMTAGETAAAEPPAGRVRRPRRGGLGRAIRPVAALAAGASVVTGAAFLVLGGDSGGGEEIDIPSAAPLGTEELLFSRTRSASNYDVLVLDVGTGEVRPTTNPDASDQLPALSPDRRSFAYTRFAGEASDLWVAGADGGEERRLAAGPVSRPAWSPDGRRLAYVALRDGQPDVYVLDLADGDEEQLTDDAGQEDDVAWSPDGSRIVFWRDVGGDNDLFAVELDTGEFQQLTEGPGIDADPSFDPSGNVIAFARETDGIWHLWRMRADGTGEEQLTFGDRSDQDPTWSPGGDRIAFESRREIEGIEDPLAIWVVDAEPGATPTLLTDGIDDDIHPAWSTGSQVTG